MIGSMQALLLAALLSLGVQAQSQSPPAVASPTAKAGNISCLQGAAQCSAQEIGGFGFAGPLVTTYGARCDGNTDDSAAFAAAFAAQRAVSVPAGRMCLTKSGVIVPPGDTLTGYTFTSGDPGAQPSSGIICPAAISNCVTVGDGASNKSSTVTNLVINGAGKPDATSTGIYINGGYDITLTNVLVSNFGYLYHLKAYPRAGIGLGAALDHVYGKLAKTAYVWQDSWPELRINQSRFGGSASYGTACYFQISGGVAGTASGPNSLIVVNTQMNAGFAEACGVNFVNLGRGGTAGGIDAQIFTFVATHWEAVNDFIRSDGTWDAIAGLRLEASDLAIDTGAQRCLALDDATSLEHVALIGNTIFCSGGFTFNSTKAGLSYVSIVGNLFNDPVTISSNNSNANLSFSGNSFNSSVHVTGKFAHFNEAADNFQSGTVTLAPTSGQFSIENDFDSKVFSSLQACVAGLRGGTVYLTDPASATYGVGQTVSGGGTGNGSIPVYCNGARGWVAR